MPYLGREATQPEKQKMKNAMITVKVSEEQLKRFNAYAKAQDRPLAQIVREALTARINRAEKTMVEPPAGQTFKMNVSR